MATHAGARGEGEDRADDRAYILHRPAMTCLFVLLDSRHEAMAIDLEFMAWLGENGVPFAIVFTKADKLGINRVQANVDAYKEKLLESWEELPPIFITSSTKKEGREELLQYIKEINASL